jgi:Phosphotransferase enzyme family
MLAHRDLALYLLKRQFITAASIVEDDLLLMDASRRNYNLKVISERGPSYFVKQGVGPDGIATIGHEAVVYELIQSLPGSPQLQCYLPHCYEYDPQEHLLILELLRDVQDFREYHTRNGRFSTTLATTMGNALSRLHCMARVAATRDEKMGFSGRLPWILSLHRPGLGIFRNISNANLQLIQIIQYSSEFRRMLDELRQGWRAITLIHHDIKWDNCLVFAPANSRRKTRLKIIDWEFADLGDPCWDAGAVFSNYLSFWLFSIPITGEEPPDRFLELAQYPLERMQPAIRAYWQAYVQGMGLDRATSKEWLLRAVKYSAARLIQTAFEHLQMSIHLTSNLVCLLQLSLNIMQRPYEAIAHLLGIPFE